MPSTPSLPAFSIDDPVARLVVDKAFRDRVWAGYSQAWPEGFLTFDHTVCLAACAATLMPVPTCLEIGVRNGRSLYYFCRFLNEVQPFVFALDPVIGGSLDETIKRIRKETGMWVKYANRRSTDEAAWYAKTGYRFDYVFIDGDHSYKGVLLDLALYWPLVTSSGLLVFHDYGHPKFPGIKLVVDQWIDAGLIRPIVQKDVCFVTRKVT